MIPYSIFHIRYSRLAVPALLAVLVLGLIPIQATAQNLPCKTIQVSFTAAKTKIYPDEPLELSAKLDLENATKCTGISAKFFWEIEGTGRAGPGPVIQEFKDVPPANQINLKTTFKADDIRKRTDAASRLLNTRVNELQSGKISELPIKFSMSFIASGQILDSDFIEGKIVRGSFARSGPADPNGPSKTVISSGSIEPPKEAAKDCRVLAITICIQVTSIDPAQPEFGKDFKVNATLSGEKLKDPLEVVIRWLINPSGITDQASIIQEGKINVQPRSDGKFEVRLNQTFTASSRFKPGQNEVGVKFETLSSVTGISTKQFTFKPAIATKDPRVEISAKPSSDPSGLVYEFSAIYFPPNSTAPRKDNSITISWNFGDQTQLTTGYDVEHTYQASGQFEVKVEAKDSSGKVIASTAKMITVAGNPTAPAGDTGLLGAIISVVNIILGALFGILRWVAWMLGNFIFVPLLDATLNFEAYDIAGGVILEGWAFVRDVVNMFFILFLIIIGLGTMLRIESYNYKKLLVMLIMMAMLVNFSLVIGRIVIQIADTAQFSFLPKDVTDLEGNKIDGLTGVRYMYQSLMTTHISNIFAGFRTLTTSSSEALSATFSLIFQTMLELGVVVTFGAMAIFMLIRTVALWILLIISPLAYALFVLPATKGIASQWWSNFLKYAFFAPILAFFLRLTLVLYQNGLGIVPEKVKERLGLTLSADVDPNDFINFLNKIQDTQVSTFNQSLELGMIYAVILAFMWAGMIVTKNMSIAGAGAIVGLAQKGMLAPLATTKLLGKGAWMGTKALAGFGAQKVLEKYGKEIRPIKWLEGWKESREINRTRREQRGMLKAEGRSTLANPVAFFQRYWGKGAVHAVKGDNKKGLKLREEAKTELVAAEKDKKEGKITEAVYQQRARNAEAKASAGFAMIHPADYFTQRKTREAVNKEKTTILGETWQELFDLAEGARREGHADRYLALFEKTAETYNENEIVNHTRYTKDMTAEKSADKKAHKAGEFFTDSWAGLENFRKQILEGELSLSEQSSMRFMADIGEIAKDRKHFNIWRLYDTKHGEYRHKPKEDWETEIRMEKGKMSEQVALGESNRLAGHDEIPSLNYDVDGVRIALTQENEVNNIVNRIDNVKFRLNRGTLNASNARALAFAPNMARLEKYAKDHLDNTVRYNAIDLKLRDIKDARGQQVQWTKMEEALYTLGELKKFGDAQYSPGEMEDHTRVLGELLRADKIEDYYKEKMRSAGYTQTAGGVTV